MSEMDLDFVISTGDNFYPAGLASIRDVQAHNWVNVYGSNIPWYICLGNHDYYGNVQAQLDMDNVYSMWNLPSRYYQKRIGDIEFWFLDTTPLLDYNPVWKTPDMTSWQDLENQRAVADEQYMWLAETLRDSNSSRKIVVGHHPLWTFGEHMHQTSGDFLTSITSLMQENNVESYLCGHDHNLQHVTSGGLHEFVSGAGAWTYEWDWYIGGRTFDDATLEYGDSENGFLVISDHTYIFYGSKGNVKYIYEIE